MRNLVVEEQGLLSNKDEPQDTKRVQKSVVLSRGMGRISRDGSFAIFERISFDNNNINIKHDGFLAKMLLRP